MTSDLQSRLLEMSARLQRHVHERARASNPLFSVEHWKHGAGDDWPHEPDDDSFNAFENCKHPDCALVRAAASALASKEEAASVPAKAETPKAPE